jgi:hypothetical protein
MLRWSIVVVSFCYPVEFETVELETLELELVVGGIGASRNASVGCTENGIIPIIKPISTNVTVEMNAIINVILSFTSI